MKFLQKSFSDVSRFIYQNQEPALDPEGTAVVNSSEDDLRQQALAEAIRAAAENTEIPEIQAKLNTLIEAEASILAGKGVTVQVLTTYLAENELDTPLGEEGVQNLSGNIEQSLAEGEPLPEDLESSLRSMHPETFLQDLPQEGGLDEEGKPTISRLDTVTSPRVSPTNLEEGSNVRFDFMFKNPNGGESFNLALWKNTTAGSVLPKNVLAVTNRGQTFTRRGFGEYFNENNQRLKIHGNEEHGHTELSVAKIGTPEELAKIEEDAAAAATEALTTAGIEKGSENFDRLSAAVNMAALKGIDVDLALALANSDVFQAIGDDEVYRARFESALIEGHRLQDGLPDNMLEAINSGDRDNKSVGYFLTFLDAHLNAEQKTELLVSLGFEEDVIENAQQSYADGLDVISGDLMGQLKAEISRHEGNYESYNRGKAGDSPGSHSPPLTSMTFGEVMHFQSFPQGHPQRIFAAGKYQLIPGTMREAVRSVGISPSDPFTAANQERLFNYLIGAKRPTLNAYITGRSTDLNAAHRDLAREFASIPGPDGRGMYDGDRAGNAAPGGVARARRVASILTAMHNESNNTVATP